MFDPTMDDERTEARWHALAAGGRLEEIESVELLMLNDVRKSKGNLNTGS